MRSEAQIREEFRYWTGKSEELKSGLELAGIVGVEKG